MKLSDFKKSLEKAEREIFEQSNVSGLGIAHEDPEVMVISNMLYEEPAFSLDFSTSPPTIII